MNRRSFFRLGFGAALSPVADKWLSVLPLLAAPAVQKMDDAVTVVTVYRTTYAGGPYYALGEAVMVSAGSEILWRSGEKIQ